MAYCSQDDILEQMDEDILIQLTDDADAGSVDDDKVTRAIADADADIDSYVGVRKDVPLDPVPTVIRKRSVDMAIYNLYARRQGAPDDRKERYDAAVRWLALVAKGEVSLGEDDPDAPPADRHAPDIDHNDVIFSRDKMTGF